MWYILGMGKGAARNYLLPISNNLEQEGDEPIDKLTPVPAADSGLLADGLTESWPESLPGLPTKQHVLVNLEPTRFATSDMMSDDS